MKKLLYPFAFALTVFLILYSCSAEEEDTTPPSTVQQPTPEPEPTAPTQYTLTVTAGDGGTVSTEGGTYDEGTEITITATPDEGYVFIGWSENQEIFSNSITVEIDNNKTLTPLFIMMPEVNTNTLWEKQGFTSAIWTTRYNNSCIEYAPKELGLFEFKKSLIDYLNTGANTIIIDWHLRLEEGLDENGAPNGSIIFTDSAHDLDYIGNKIELAKSFGLEVWIKPIVLTQTNWQTMKPKEPATWFENYIARIDDLLNNIDSSTVDALLITNELCEITTDTDYIENWEGLIQHFRDNYSFSLGINVQGVEPNLESGYNEWKNVSHLTDKLDFIGLSTYVAYGLTNGTEYPSEDELYQGWFSNNEGKDMIKGLNDYIEQSPIPVYITELGARPTPNLRINYDNQIISTTTQDNFFKATLRVFKENVTELRGVFGYCWSEADVHPCKLPNGEFDSKRLVDGESYQNIEEAKTWIINYNSSINTFKTFFSNSN